MREKLELAERARREAEYREWDTQRQLQALREAQSRVQQQPPPEPEQPPDLFTDPAGYTAYMQRQIMLVREQARADMRNQEANFSFRIAHDRNGEEFEQAFNGMLGLAQRGDPAVVQWVMQSPDPGAAVMSWYRDARSRAQLDGRDPETWFNQRLDEQLKDPKIAGAILEKIRAHQQGNGQAQQGGPARVDLPPSLQRLPASAPPTAGGDLSDTSLFDVAFRQGRTRR
jgi:hypothetical protein